MRLQTYRDHQRARHFDLVGDHWAIDLVGDHWAIDLVVVAAAVILIAGFVGATVALWAR
jgi:hypothetical protein